MKRRDIKNYTLFRLISGFFKLLRPKNIAFVIRNRKKIERNMGHFLKEEEKEVEELLTGKESARRYFCDTKAILKDYFIPHDGNGDRPKILRAEPMAVIAISLIILKMLVFAYVFVVYTRYGQMSGEMVPEILALTNQDRKKNGLEPLRLNSALNRSASLKAADMIANNYFAHHSPAGKKPWDWVDRDSYSYVLVGENLGMNFISAAEVHQALMNSPSHKKNILNERYEDIGLAVVSGKINGEETNILVELFAAKKEAVPVASVAKSEATRKPAATISKPAVKPVTPAPAPTRVEPKMTPAKAAGTIAPAKKQEEPSKPNLASLAAPSSTAQRETASKTDELPPEPAGNAMALAAAESEGATGTAEIAAGTAPDTPWIDGLTDHEVAVLASSQNMAGQTLFAMPAERSGTRFSASFLNASKSAYAAVLILLSAALLVNILVRIRVQHRPVIVRALFFMVLIAGLMLINPDYSLVLDKALEMIMVA